jgi:hypothetical protein
MAIKLKAALTNIPMAIIGKKGEITEKKSDINGSTVI